jgi:hypothetical protein
MHPLFTDPELLQSLRQAGVHARLAKLVWHGDLDGHSFLLVSEGELERLERWDGGVAEGGSHAHRLIQPLTSAGTFGKV